MRHRVIIHNNIRIPFLYQKIILVTHFESVFPFFTLSKNLKNLLMFSGGKKGNIDLKWVKFDNFSLQFTEKVFWIVEKLAFFLSSRRFSIKISQFRIMTNQWKFYIELIFNHFYVNRFGILLYTTHCGWSVFALVTWLLVPNYQTSS